MVLVPLGKLANLATGENVGLSCLKIALHDQSPVVDQPVLMDDVEDFFVNVNQPRGDEETT